VKKEELIVCPSCAAEFGKDNAKCPFCGVMYYPGAEKAYMEHLEEVKEDLSDLQYMSGEAVKEEAKKVGKLLKKVAIILVILIAIIVVAVFFLQKKAREQEREDFIYRQANFPVFDEMYENGEYDELADKYNEALLEGYDMWSWEHRDFISVYGSIRDAEDAMARLDAGEKPEQAVIAGLIWNEWNVIMYVARDVLDEQEKGYIDSIKDSVIDDLKTRWGMSEEELKEWYDRLAADHHIITYDECEKFAKDWIKRNKK